MNKLLEKIPYDDLEGVSFSYMLAGAIGIGLVLFIAYFFILHSVANKEFEKLTKKKESVERTLKRYKLTAAKEERVARNLIRTDGKFNAFKSQMPATTEIPYLVKRITEFGNNRKLKMVSLTLEEGEIGSFYKEVPLKIQMLGEFWTTLDFIDYMQNLLYLVNFDSLALTAQTIVASDTDVGEGSTASLNTTLTVKTYSFLKGAENRVPAKKTLPNKKRKKKGGH